MAKPTISFDKKQDWSGVVEKVHAQMGGGWFSVKIRFDAECTKRKKFREFVSGTGLVNCTGDCKFELVKGMHISMQVEGAVVDPKYGVSFCIMKDSMHVICDNETSAVAYLTLADGGDGSVCSQVGAKNLFKRYGSRVLDAIRKEPDAELRKYSKRPAELRMFVIVNDLLEGLKSIHDLLTPQVCEKAIERWGEDSYTMITENPYRLAHQLNWDVNKADDIAVALKDLNFADPFRVNNLITYAVSRICMEHQGSFVYLNDDNITKILAITNSVLLKYKGRLFTPMFGIQDTPDNRQKLRSNIESNEDLYLARWGANLCVYLRTMYDLEISAAEHVAAAVKHGSFHDIDEIHRLVDEYDAILRARNLRESGKAWGLDNDQKAAIASAFTSKIAIINGGAGTGKSTIVDGVVYVGNALALKKPVIMTPTHKAKKRLLECLSDDSKHILTDKSDMRISTIALFLQCSVFETPLYKTSGSFVIVDESSMLSLWQAEKLLHATEDAAHVIFVGDFHQLPSIDSGCFFKDICLSSYVTRRELLKCYRAEGAVVVQNSWRINNGDAALEWKADEFEFHEYYYDNYANIIAEEYASLIEKGESFTDVCCLSPAKSLKFGTGVEAINMAIQARLNPLMDMSVGPYVNYGEAEYSLDKGHKGYSILLINEETGYGFRIGDRVVAVSNSIRSVKNGDTGVIKAFTYPDDPKGADRMAAKVHIEMDSGATVSVTRDQLRYKFMLGYCVTIHKSQGSEYRHLLVSVPNDRRLYNMMSRELIYTAVTRAKRCVKLYGSWHTMCAAIQKPPEHRNSLLTERIDAIVKKG